MPDRILFLGTGAAVASADHDNAHLLIQAGNRLVLVDCPSNPIPKLHRLGIDLVEGMTDLVLTHFHADHVSGFAVLLQTAWLLGRKQPLTVHGLGYTLDRAEGLLQLFNAANWPDMFPIRFHRIAEMEMQAVITTPELNVFGSPVKHLIPNLGLRFEWRRIGKSAAYSSDTAPSPAVVQLAHEVDALVHESTGATTGHSSAEQAGEIARDAGAKRLYLIHYESLDCDPTLLVERARRAFAGDVTLAVDGMEIQL